MSLLTLLTLLTPCVFTVSTAIDLESPATAPPCAMPRAVQTGAPPWRLPACMRDIDMRPMASAVPVAWAGECAPISSTRRARGCAALTHDSRVVSA